MVGTPRVVAVVQARLGSSRLPAKVLAPLAGHPVLHRVIRRLERAALVDDIVIATTVLSEDDPLVAYARTLGCAVFRGSSNDLLARYRGAASEARADVVVRITSDCPMVDPTIVDHCVSLLLAEGVDYASNTLEPRTYPRGLDVEAFTMTALVDVDRVDDDLGTREHVTPKLKEAPNFSRRSFNLERDLSAIRWTVDTVEDLNAVRAVFEYFNGSDSFNWTEALDAWTENPAWATLNSHVAQKPVIRMKPRTEMN